MPFPLPPGSTIGILGGGQLGRMLALAAARLGFDVAILEPEPDAPAARVAAHAVVGGYDDPAALADLARLADVVTVEFENVPAAAVARLVELGAQVAPGERALAVAQDRVDGGVMRRHVHLDAPGQLALGVDDRDHRIDLVGRASNHGLLRRCVDRHSDVGVLGDQLLSGVGI